MHVSFYINIQWNHLYCYLSSQHMLLILQKPDIFSNTKIIEICFFSQSSLNLVTVSLQWINLNQTVFTRKLSYLVFTNSVKIMFFCCFLLQIMHPLITEYVSIFDMKSETRYIMHSYAYLCYTFTRYIFLH